MKPGRMAAMNTTELLLPLTPAGPLGDGAPWQVYNLRRESDPDDGVAFAVADSTRNGHLEQTMVAPTLAPKAQLQVVANLKADGPELVGVNVYLYPHDASDDGRQVFQLQHPGDGCWHMLTRIIPMPDGPLARLRLLVVARRGAAGFRAGFLSLRPVLANGEQSEIATNGDPISPEYRDAVHAFVEKHPSAGDPAFREKLTRYLLGTNRNGAKNLARVLPVLAEHGIDMAKSRFLDLGSGSGGALVAALRAGATYAEGWEINEDKRRLSEINVTTCGADVRRVRVLNRSMDDATGPGAGFNPFDVVFCEEVLEHVKDLDRAIDTLARAIALRGVGYITMPNGFAVQSVLSDPHLQLFGIALLDRFEAQPLATALKNHRHYSEMMGTYCRHDDYVERFGAVGLRLAPVESSDATPKAVERDLHLVAEKRKALRKDWGDTVDGATLSLLESRLDGYLEEVRARLLDVEREGTPEAGWEAFLRDFGQPHFTYIAEHA